MVREEKGGWCRGEGRAPALSLYPELSCVSPASLSEKEERSMALETETPPKADEGFAVCEQVVLIELENI